MPPQNQTDFPEKNSNVETACGILILANRSIPKTNRPITNVTIFKVQNPNLFTNGFFSLPPRDTTLSVMNLSAIDKAIQHKMKIIVKVILSSFPKM